MLHDYPYIFVKDRNSSNYPRVKHNHMTWIQLQHIYRAEATKLHRTSPTLETSGLRDAAYAGLAVAEAALANRESAGAHCIIPDATDSDSDDEQVAAAR